MTIPPRHILEEVFREGYPDRVVEAIVLVGIARGRHSTVRALSEAWLRDHGGSDTHGVALWLRRQLMRQGGNE
ncbi:hypothetical protein UFOVP73_36 [uncultured Caudovirales phage]|uniref:Uncharacterized protein n=1 Tax=uncultured Caudovirales phage TaxID=2100421 RepID=A0A6J5KVQ6_9CAUD|nr:hypothetical protein UFOVP73_36 [uncultured Caudovirales phage]CAB5195174.1 hypothetical protein UFOVP170_58 [uncultured Caudovirales phage]